MPLSPGRFLWFLVAASAAFVLTNALSLRATRAARDAATRARAEAHALAAARDRQAVLADLQPTAAQLEQIKHDLSALAATRVELETARAEYQRTSVAALRRPSRIAPETRAPPSRVDPAAVLQSVLRAVADGEAEELVTLIDLEATARAEANAFLASLPQDVRAGFPTVEHLIASVMVAKTDAEFAEARIDASSAINADESQVRTTLLRADGTSRAATFRLHRRIDGWRLRVPLRVIEGYRALVTGVSETG